MIGRTGVNVAVPDLALLKWGDEDRLALEAVSWAHLNGYIGAVEALPAGFTSGSAAVDDALARVRAQVARFGSPRQVRAWVRANPDTWAKDPAPPTLLANVVWLVKHLQLSATTVASMLEGIQATGASGAAVKERLARLGSVAEEARRPIGPLAAALDSFKSEVEAANGRLSNACKALAESLQHLQEDVGAARVRVETSAQEVEKAWPLGRKQKREKLEAMRLELAGHEKRAEALRAVVAMLEPILAEGHWLPSGVADLAQFLDRLRKAWTSFGSGVTQLVADGSDAQLEDAAWLAQVLRTEEATKQWSAIARATGRFVGEAIAAPE